MQMIYVLILFVLVGLVLLVVGLIGSRKSVGLDDRIAEFGTLEQPLTLEELELSQPFSERIVLPLVRGLAQFVMRFTPRQSMQSTQHQLDLAGNPYGWSSTEFMGIRLLVTLLLGGLGFVMFVTAGHMALIRRIMIAAGAVVMGYYMPIMWLKAKTSRRQQSILRSLPDALDLLTICVEAGLGFDSAMARVVDKWETDLSDAFGRVLQELQLGKLRREALRDMSDRMEVPDVSAFIAAIIQADQLGVSIARVLRIQSDQMRMRRRQRAEELARSAGIKMMPAIAFLIFPSIFIILLGPAALQLMGSNSPFSSSF